MPPTTVLQLLLFFFFFFFFLSSQVHTVAAAGNTLHPGDTIGINRTIVSSAGTFALGFFIPRHSPSTSFYLAIWYNDTGDDAAVWVANRDSPVADSAAVLALQLDGNLVLSDSDGSKIWSSNTSSTSNGTEAVLLDSGNLVLRSGDADTTIWESFDHPTDTLLPNMRIVSYFGIGVATRIVSWKTSSDPATGTFSLGIDPRTFMQAFIWRGSEPYWRSNAWNGSVTFTENEDNESISSFYITSLSGGKQNMSWSYMVTQGFPATRLVIEETGFLRLLTWQAASKSWVTRASYPNMEFGACVLYNQCGPNGMCVGRNATLSCKCFAEFSPNNSTEWAAGNYSGGCVKKTRWDCSKGGFYKVYSKMKLPDGMLLLRDAGASECEANCSATCNCTAYSFDSTRSIESTTRCLVWLGDMIDLVQNSSGMDELHVRVSAADLDNNSQCDGHSHKRKRLLVIMLTVGTAAMLLSGTTCYFMWARHMRLGKTRRLLELRIPDTIGSDKGAINVPLVDFFSIRKATDDFAVTNKLGEGGFGSVYKGRLEDGQFIAVKRLSENSKQGFEELNNEVKLIVRLQHTNLVRLLGWCIHENEKMLIYEYMPNKSLDKYLFGIAQGLLYLHRYSRLRIIHRDLKTSNILLDENMIPKISDFGLARIFGESHMEQNTRRVVGTFGYMAPEYGLHGRFSEKSDVYSFGVILLEIISGKRNSGSYSINDSFSLLGYAWYLWVEGRSCELVDPQLIDSFPVSEVEKCVQLGLLCVQDRSTDRPTMDAIAIMLVNRNPVLPSPQQPAHASTMDSPTLVPIPYSWAPELTMSTIEGR
ncbi:receptor-like serine/threonine-protein kinase SD1-8 isoform X2 [Zingiber officinale]|uniref:receptor-like serine/threonine-protein kinase SD1-8 isoform X2 n=1 Tax=Zingiber officinale TaxID=94328 RepID=UPI001C4DCC7E|nr:receptor-like serine/threonine-protein kinase SD1-8 isoform X2 [Zingiber officinale]